MIHLLPMIKRNQHLCWFSLPSKEGEFYSAKIEVNIHQINEENVIMTVEPNQSRYFNLKKGQAYTGIFL